MKKLLSIVFVMSLFSVASIAATSTGSTYTETWVNKKANELTAPLAQKEKELAEKQAAYEKAQNDRQAEQEARAQQIQKDVDNLKNSIDAFKKYGR